MGKYEQCRIIYVGEMACVTLQIFFSATEHIKEQLVLVCTAQMTA